MSREQALDALRSGDFSRAATLLEPLVRRDDFDSDILNHAYTLALRNAGRGAELANAAFEIGRRYTRRRPGMAADYFQRAILSGVPEERVQQVIRWQESLAQTGVRKARGEVRLDRVAHVLGCFLPGHAPSLYIQLLSRSLADLGVQSHVFTTEWTSSWFFNPEGVKQSEPPPVDAGVTVAAIDGDFFERAERIARDVRASDCDIVLYHCGPSEQITIRVAALHPAPVQINVNHAEEISAGIFEGFAHLFRNGLERTRMPQRAKRWIPLVSNIEERLKTADAVPRSSIELDAATTVSGTFGNLFKASEPVFLETLCGILRRHPGHFHVFAGAGDPEPIVVFMSDAGLIDRVRFVEHIPDIAGMLGTIDLYLNSFPVSGGQSILEPMAVAIPSVIRRYPYETHYNVGAELAGVPELQAGSEEEYAEIAHRLITDTGLRRRCGLDLQARFQARFRPDGLGAHYMDFFREVLEGLA